MARSIKFLIIIMFIYFSCLAEKNKSLEKSLPAKQDFRNIFNFLGRDFGCRAKHSWIGIKLLSKHIILLENDGDSDTEYYRSTSYKKGKLSAENFLEGHYDYTTTVRKSSSHQSKIELKGYKDHLELTVFKRNSKNQKKLICKPRL